MYVPIWSYSDLGTKITRYQYDKNNRLILETDNESYTEYSYDKAGNLIKKLAANQTEYYEYDGYNRMTAMHNGITEAEYEYGISGLRRSKTVNGKQTRFVYSGADIIGEITEENYYIYYRGTELLGSKSYSGSYTFYRQNAHGDVTAITTANGEERTYEYSPFGEKRPIIHNPMGADSILYQWKAETESTYNPFGYCGEYTDAETGFIYLRNRYYSPSLGRFTTEDPVRDGWNWYAYAGNNPVMSWDYWGLADEKIRVLTEFLGGDIKWSDSNKSATVVVDGVVNNYSVTDNGAVLYSNKSIGRLENNRMIVNVEDFYNSFGYSSEDNGELGKYYIASTGSGNDGAYSATVMIFYERYQDEYNREYLQLNRVAGIVDSITSGFEYIGVNGRYGTLFNGNRDVVDFDTKNKIFSYNASDILPTADIGTYTIMSISANFQFMRRKTYTLSVVSSYSIQYYVNEKGTYESVNIRDIDPIDILTSRTKQGSGH